MNYFLSKIAKLNIDVLSELALVLPPTFLFPVVDERLLAVGGVYVFERMLSPTSKYRWRIVNHHTTVTHIDDDYSNLTVWRLNGELHREQDQPAVVWANGDKAWWFHGDRHREGGKPARVWADGSKEWWVNGKCHREQDKPAIVYSYPNGYMAWYQHGWLHRNGDQPARTWTDGRKEWWFNGLNHREDDKPAAVYPNGDKEWWVNGKQIIKTN